MAHSIMLHDCNGIYSSRHDPENSNAFTFQVDMKSAPEKGIYQSFSVTMFDLPPEDTAVLVDAFQKLQELHALRERKASTASDDPVEDEVAF